MKSRIPHSCGEARRFPSVFAPFALVLGLCFAAVTAWGGGGPQNYLLVYDPALPDNIAIANHYKATRGIPESNVFAYDFPKNGEGTIIKSSISTQECFDFILSLREFIDVSNLNRIDGIVLAGVTPTRVNGQPYDAGQRSSGVASLTAALYYAPNVTSVTDLDPAIHANFGFYNQASDFNQTAEIRSDKNYSGDRYWLAMHLGYTGPKGIRVETSLDLITQSFEADGTKEMGTIYWPINADVRSETREPQIPSATADWDALGLAYHIFGRSDRYNVTYGGVSAGRRIAEDKTGAPGSTPIEERAVQGMICGFSPPQDLENANNRYTKGAIAEHLTSTGGFMGDGLFRSSQMPLSEWLHWGAYATSGTVAEPLAYDEKFPHASLHTNYFRGASLAEAFMLSVQNPRQLLVVGDPLMQPYATIPGVNISGLANGASISGNRTLNFTTSGAILSSRDLFVNGRRVQSFTGNSVTLDTTTLSDGYHELRVVVYGNTPVRTQGSDTRWVRVNNSGANVSLTTASTTLNYRSERSVTASVSGLANVSRVEIVANGAVLAELPGNGGSTNLHGKWLGHRGVTKVFAVAVLNNGTEVWSAPLEMSVNWPNLPAQSVNVGSALARANFWTDGSAPGFNWTNPDQSQLVSDRQYLIYGNEDGFIDFPMVTSATLGTAAMEFVTYFNAEQAGHYEFAADENCGIQVLVDGELIIDVSAPTNNPGVLGQAAYSASGSERLAAGRHEIRIRIPRIQSRSGFRVGVRSLDTRFFPDGRPQDAILDFVQFGRNGNCAAATGTPTPTNNPPAISVDFPATAEVGVPVNLDVVATDSDGVAWVKLSRDGSYFSSSTNVSGNLWRTVWTPEAAGTYSFVVRAQDQAADPMIATSDPIAITVEVDDPVGGGGGQNLLFNSDFANAFVLNGGWAIADKHAGQGWVRHSASSTWTHDAANDQADAGSSGAQNLVQIIEDNGTTTGMATLVVEAGGFDGGDELEVFVYGVDGDFRINLYNDLGAQTRSSPPTPIPGTELLRQSLTGSATLEVPLGGSGYDYLAVMLRRASGSGFFVSSVTLKGDSGSDRNSGGAATLTFTDVSGAAPAASITSADSSGTNWTFTALNGRDMEVNTALDGPTMAAKGNGTEFTFGLASGGTFDLNSLDVFNQVWGSRTYTISGTSASGPNPASVTVALGSRSSGTVTLNWVGLTAVLIDNGGGNARLAVDNIEVE